MPYHHTQFLAAAGLPTHHPAQSQLQQQHLSQAAHHHHHQQQQQQQQRSPIDVLMRVFPSRRRSDVEQLMQRFRGDVLQAMECMLAGEDLTTQTPPPSVPSQQQQQVPPSPPFPMKSAFSPLVAPAVFGSPTHPHRYHPFMQAHAKRFLSAPYAGTGYLPGVLSSADLEQSESNGAGGIALDRTSNAGDSQD